MSYQLKPIAMAFARLDQCELCAPAHGLVALHGSTVVPVKALGLTAGNSTKATALKPPCRPWCWQTPTATPPRCKKTAP